MRIYFDVSCLNRPFDDQRQPRIRLEAEAVLLALQRVDAGDWTHLSSDMAVAEINAMSDVGRRNRVLTMVPGPTRIMRVTAPILRRSGELARLRIGAADAVRVAAAEAWRADVLLTCDDQLLRAARRHRAALRVNVANPLAWMEQHARRQNP